MNLDAPSELVLAAALRRYSKRELATALGTDPRTVIRWGAGKGMARHWKLSIIGLMSGSRQSAASKSEDFTFIDLFAGIGGMRLGFESAGGRCVFSSEWDESCKRTYRLNFGEDEDIYGDITQLVRDERFDLIRAHDVLLAGFPCQPFSIAGVSKKKSLGRAHGFACEAQGTLFFDVAAIIKAHRPAAIVLENVKNLQSHDRGNTFRVIKEILVEELGYRIFPKVIDAKGFVPQHRERIFIVGFRDEVGFSWDAFRGRDPDAKKLGSILHPEDGTEEPEKDYTVGVKAKVNPKYTLSPHLWNYLQAYRDKHAAKGNGFGFGLFGPADVARTLSARYYKDGSEILIRQKRKNPRRLTPRECARLMGFDNQDRRFQIPVSDTAAYKQFGNSVVVPVVEEIARIVKPHVADLTLRAAEGVAQHDLFAA